MMASRRPLTELMAMAALIAVCVACGSGDAGSTPEESPGSEADGSSETAGSSSDATADASGPLAGTRWQLVSFQSMDDAVGTQTPENPADYTMSLEADGSVAFKLNCNRGTGTWSAEPSAEGDGGSFGFGPLATTKALCPPPSMDERIARDTEYVRSFRLVDGRLHLTLMADGGIYTWEPLEDVAAVPSFDCSEAEGAVEELICRDEELAELDRELADLWPRALENLPEEEKGTATAYQRGWIGGRNECWKETDDVAGCVRREYETRLTELQIRGGLVMAPDYVSMQCEDGQPLLATFYSETKTPAAVLTRGDDQVIAFIARTGSGSKYEGRNVLYEEHQGTIELAWNGETTKCSAPS